MSNSFNRGDRVYLTHDPGRNGGGGVITGKTRTRGVRVHHQVHWNTGEAGYVPEDQLSISNDEERTLDPLELLIRGRLGDVKNLRRILTHERLSGRLADIIYSMDTTGTDFYAFQFKPLVKLLNSATDGILIADEVGLGKTIEAGLIWTELRQRFDFRRLMVVCPAMLREKWKKELIQRFGVDAEIVNAGQCLGRLRRSLGEASSGSFAMVGSMEGLRPPRGWLTGESRGKATDLARFLQERQNDEPLVDLTIIDEAHYLRNPATVTNLLARLLRGASQYIVLLSATPIQLKSENLFHLLHLVDEATFDQIGAFESILEASKPLVRARQTLLAREGDRVGLLRSLEVAQQNPLLRKNRQLADLIENLPAEQELVEKEVITNIAGRLETLNPLGHVVSRSRKREVLPDRVERKVVPEEIPLSQIEAGVYEAVTEIVREYCLRDGAPEGFLLVTPQRQLASSIPAACMHWERRARLLSQEAACSPEDGAPSASFGGQVSEDLGIEMDLQAGGGQLPEQLGPLTQYLAEKVGELGNLEELKANDSKYSRLHEKLTEYFARFPDEKVVLFSYFRVTLDYLRERLRKDGVETFILKGGMGEKDQLVEDFKNHKGAAILLSSEVGSEGIDLQFCRVVVNYDLPWNPMKVEQRIGRIDRLGQEAEVILVWNLFSQDTIDSRIYERLFKRLKIFEDTLGAIEEVLGDEIRELTNSLMSGQLSVEEELERIEQTAIALENRKQQEGELEEKAAEFMAYGDFILNQVTAAKALERTVKARDLLVYVADHFKKNYEGCEFVKVGKDPYRFKIGLSIDAKQALKEFIRAEKIDFSTAFTQASRPKVDCRFKNSAVSKAGDTVEMISQFHPLVRFVTWELRQPNAQPPNSAVALRLQLDAEDALGERVRPGIYVFAVQHWSVSGIQNIEKLYYVVAPYDGAGGLLSPEDSERLLMLGVSQGENWINFNQVDFEKAYEVANEVCMQQCDTEYSTYVSDLVARNEDRADLQLENLDKGFRLKLEQLEERIQEHRRKGQERVIPMWEGQISALRQRVEMKRRSVEGDRVLRDSKKEVCVGVIKVEIESPLEEG